MGDKLPRSHGPAGGVSCRFRRSIWAAHRDPVARVYPSHAVGTQGPLGDEITSIEASFDFSARRSARRRL